MVASVHMRLSCPLGQGDARALYARRYANEPTIVLRDEPPSTGDVRGSNRAHVHVAVDAERGMATAVCALDNLAKGAAGQAVQAANVALGLDETAGIPMFPVLP
jgi:N-acetyl-gamma-glutamyl-phosphate reductase